MLIKRLDGTIMKGPFPFFLAQAVAISCEEGIIAILNYMFNGDKVTLHKIGRAVGYVWTVAWLGATVPYFVEFGVVEGVGWGDALPFSIVGSMAKLVWN